MGIIENVELLGGNHRQSRTVRKILENEVYTGTMVRGKAEVTRRKQLPVPQDEWLRVESIHPAIILQDLFESVQQRFFDKAVNEPKQETEQYTPNLFKGKIFCGHCGRRLDRKKNHQHYVYRCTANYTVLGSCPGNSIREEALTASLSRVLLEYAESMNDEQFASESVNSLETELAELQVESSYDKDTSRTPYEAFVTEKITERQFLDLKAKYNRRKEWQNERWVQLSLQKAEQAARMVEQQDLLATLKEFQDPQLLTCELIERLVKKIEVFGGGRIYVGLKVQRCLRLNG